MASVDRMTFVRLVAGIVLVAAVATSAQQQTAADAADRLLTDRRWDEAQAAFESLLATATQTANVNLERRALLGLTQVFLNKADFTSARDFGRRALALSEAINDRRGRAVATTALLRTQPEDSPEYAPLMAQALDRARESGDANFEGEVAHLHGDRLFNTGDYTGALAELERAAASYSSVGNTEELGAVYNSVGRVYRAHGQLQEALAYQMKALQLHEGGRNSYYRIQSLNAVAAVYGMLGEIDKARSFAERALKIAEQSGTPRVQDFLRANLASYLADQGEYSRAVGLLEGVIARGGDAFVGRRYSALSVRAR